MFRKSIVMAACFAVTAAAMVLSQTVRSEAADPTAGVPEGKPVAELAKTEVTGKPPLEILKDHPLGSMRNPFTDDATKIEEGKKLYFSYSCNGCHGGGGGGGMCPPLTNETWVYGAADDTLYRLITQGTVEFTKENNVKRKGQEGVVGPMPPFGELIKSDEEVWKILAFVRSTYKGSKRSW